MSVNKVINSVTVIVYGPDDGYTQGAINVSGYLPGGANLNGDIKAHEITDLIYILNWARKQLMCMLPPEEREKV